MSAPALFSAVFNASSDVAATDSASNPFSSDQFNTLVQSCNTLCDLSGFTPSGPLQVYLRGIGSPGDGGQGDFWWNASNALADDRYNIVVPGGMIGSPPWPAWVRISGMNPYISPTSSPLIWNGGSVTLTFGPSLYVSVQLTASSGATTTTISGLSGVPSLSGAVWRAMLQVKQDIVGQNKLVFPTSWFVAGGGQKPQVSLAAGATDIFSIFGYTIGTTSCVFLGVVGQNWVSGL